jgi:hypothetical protein
MIRRNGVSIFKSVYDQEEWSQHLQVCLWSGGMESASSSLSMIRRNGVSIFKSVYDHWVNTSQEKYLPFCMQLWIQNFQSPWIKIILCIRLFPNFIVIRIIIQTKLHLKHNEMRWCRYLQIFGRTKDVVAVMVS